MTMSGMDNDDKASLLAGVPFFSKCSARELRDIAHLSEERFLTKGADLCRQGDFENEVFLIVDGEAEVIIDGRSVGRTRAGEVVGELAMLGDGRRTATLLVIKPMRVLVFDPREVDSVLAADPSSAQRLSRHSESKSDQD